MHTTAAITKINIIFRRNHLPILSANVHKNCIDYANCEHSVIPAGNCSYFPLGHHMLKREELIHIFFELSSMLLLLMVGLYFTAKSGLFQIRGLRFISRHTLRTILKNDSRTEGVSAFQALTTALAGTMGVGNISGVATALVAGGPGAIAWMWLSAILGMSTKYAEIFLAVKFHRIKNGQRTGGAMYYIEDGLGMKRLAAAFALLCALCSLGIGNLAQINSISGVMKEGLAVPPVLCGVVVAALTGLVICGGTLRIVRVTELLIPMLSIIYLFFCAAFLWINRGLVPAAFSRIITGAFGLREAAGGALGYGVSRAMRLGLSRGVFTNEAGLGSAPIAHASANCREPSHQAAWGVFEVFLDTIVMCTITALVILCAGGGRLLDSGLDGAPLTAAAFESAFPGIGAIFLAIAIAFFAFAAITGWYFYGESALLYLFKGRRAVGLYRIIFLVCILVGPFVELGAVWHISDILNSLMAVPNCIALLLLGGQVQWGDKSIGRKFHKYSKNNPKNSQPVLE